MSLLKVDLAQRESRQVGSHTKRKVNASLELAATCTSVCSGFREFITRQFICVYDSKVYSQFKNNGLPNCETELVNLINEFLVFGLRFLGFRFSLNLSISRHTKFHFIIFPTFLNRQFIRLMKSRADIQMFKLSFMRNQSIL